MTSLTTKHAPKPKTLLRKKFLKKRASLVRAACRKKCEAIHRNFWTFLCGLSKCQTVALYADTQNEVTTLGLWVRFKRHHKRVVYPRVIRSGRGLRYFEITRRTALRAGAYGILEPHPSCPSVPLSSIDLFVIPAIVFDKKGHRIGYGKGYYDRLLQKVDRRKTIGLAYDFQVISKIPARRWDRKVGAVVTEKGIRKFV